MTKRASCGSRIKRRIATLSGGLIQTSAVGLGGLRDAADEWFGMPCVGLFEDSTGVHRWCFPVSSDRLTGALLRVLAKESMSFGKTCEVMSCTTPISERVANSCS